MKIDACVRIGHVIKSHGLKGEVRIDLEVRDPYKYKNLESVFIDIDGKLVPFFIESFRIDGTSAVLKFEGINTKSGTEIIQSKSVYVESKNAFREDTTLDNDNREWNQFIKFVVIDAKSGELGTITGIDENPGQNRLIVEGSYGKLLIPAVEPIIAKIDTRAQKVFVDLPDGFLDIYDQ